MQSILSKIQFMSPPTTPASFSLAMRVDESVPEGRYMLANVGGGIVVDDNDGGGNQRTG